MAKIAQLAVVLSDIHIGDNTPTCWYQAKVHDPYLERIFDYVVENKDKIHELILLGDMFDVWTYPPSVRPPGMKEILKANPKMLGSGGPLARACKALPGHVTLVLGNHDGTLTSGDIDELNKSLGLAGTTAAIKFLPGGRRACEGPTGLRTIFEHGHRWCMFNANDPGAPAAWNQLPVGHFVTRAISYSVKKRLKKGQTAADLAGMGNPNGIDLKALLNWKVTLDPDLVETLLDYVCDVTKMPKTEPITMPDGSISSVEKAKKLYASLFTRWHTREGGRKLDAARSAMADNWGEHLAWFAQRLAIQERGDLVVFGHTHHAVDGFFVSPVSYANSGYECVSIPDGKKTPFSFAVVDKTTASADIFQVVKSGKTYDIKPYAAKPIDVIVSPMMDYSCYVRIENLSTRMLKLVGTPRVSDSFWVVPPPPVIGPGKRVDMWLQDNPGVAGSDGGFTYNDGFGKLDFDFACPTGLSSNRVGSPLPDWTSRVGTNPWTPRSVRKMGHPVEVRFTVAKTTITRAAPAKPVPAVAGLPV